MPGTVAGLDDIAGVPAVCRTHRLFVTRLQRLENLIKMAHDTRVGVDQQHARSAARRRLDSERTGPREEIETACTDELTLKPVEELLSHPIGGRTQTLLHRKRQPAPAPPPPDNAQARRRCSQLSHRLNYPGKSSTCAVTYGMPPWHTTLCCTANRTRP